MKFPDPLISGRLVRRYKRFLSDVELSDGSVVVAHCANSGSMLGLTEPGYPVWLSPARNPERKLKFTWELVDVGDSLVGINTSLPNGIVAEAIANKKIREVAAYEGIRKEVRYGKNSRIDILLEQDGLANCYVEVKSVTLSRDKGLAEFPDAVTKRGAKHLSELSDMVAQGHRAVMFFLVQRSDCKKVDIAEDIDPDYKAAFAAAVGAGVEVLAYDCDLTNKGIQLRQSLPVIS
ncbi:MAG: DNA/RNA nuclease SfsA [Pseudomonadota bacterium]